MDYSIRSESAYVDWARHFILFRRQSVGLIFDLKWPGGVIAPALSRRSGALHPGA